MPDHFYRPRRTRRRSTTVLALACVVMVAACSVPALASAAPEDNTYVALGDSLAYGLGASSPNTKGYVGLLYSDYQSSLGVTQLYNLGQLGATSTSLRYGGQLATALALINASSDTRAVTIDIGYNDGCVFTYGAETCPLRANLAAVLGDLQTALGSDPGEEAFSEMLYYNPVAGTPFEGVYDRILFGDNLSLGCSDTGANAGLNDVIAQEAGRLGIPLANPYPAFKQNGQAFVGPDRLHPNDAGYAAIEHAFLNVGLLCSVQGQVSARGTVQTVQGSPIAFSAANNCNPAQSTRPSIVTTTAGGRIWTKSTVTASSCTDQPPASSLGFDTQTGSATGAFGPAAPGGRNGQTGTLTWTYYDNSPDTVQFTLKNSSNNVVFQAAVQTPTAYRGSSGGVWTFGP